MPNLLHKIFNKNQSMKNGDQIDDKKRQDKIDESRNPQIKGDKGLLQLQIGSSQSIGRQRDHNEDSLFTFSSLIADGQGQQSFGLFIVADGMGGHQNGEIASSVAVRAASKYLVEHIFSNLLLRMDFSIEEGVQESLRKAINAAQDAVIHAAPGGGTTMTIAVLLGSQVTLAHVGDSRAYFFLADGSVQRLTKDHSFVQHLIDLNEITEEEAAVHPQKNIILKAVGQSESYTPDIQTIAVPQGSTLLLCSDGLWGVVSEDEMNTEIQYMADPIETSRKLVNLANQAGGPDNISVILIKYPVF